MLKPMLCKDAEGLAGLEDNPDWALEGKFDGWRTIVACNGDVKVYGGRNGSSYTGKLPYLEASLRGALPADTVVDGELMHRLKPTCGAVQSIMAATGAHEPTDSSPPLYLVVFDVLQLNGADVTGLPWENRRKLLEMIQWPEHSHLNPVCDVSREAHLHMLDLGLEGSVVKKRASRYTPGLRSHEWLKLKAIDTVDCEVIGFKMGEGAGNKSEVGAFAVRLPTGVETTIKVPTKKLVEQVTADPENFRGRVIEVAHNGIMESGKPRHPRFKIFRDDRTTHPPAPAITPSQPQSSGRKSMRNYGAMGPQKLMQALKELNGGFGDAYSRVTNGRYAGDLTEHIAVATEAARKKGLL